MTIILDNFAIPEKGMLEININVSVEIRVTAEQAQRRVNRWLMEFVSTQMGAYPPTLIVDGARVVWRVPAYISFPHTGRAGIVGHIDVDVRNGEMNNTPEVQAEIEKHATEISQQQPPFKLRELSAEYLTGGPKGAVEDKATSVKVTAYQARKKVNYWLMEYISTQMGAEEPTLIEADQAVWRVPVYISFPHVGKVSGVGLVDVDARTGELIDPPGCKAQIEEHLEKKVKPL